VFPETIKRVSRPEKAAHHAARHQDGITNSGNLDEDNNSNQSPCEEEIAQQDAVPVASALLACFPQIFITASSAKRACRLGGNLQAFWPASQDRDSLKLGKAAACRDCVRAGARMLLVVLKGNPYSSVSYVLEFARACVFTCLFSLFA
jgi:hypothetical protein